MRISPRSYFAIILAPLFSVFISLTAEAGNKSYLIYHGRITKPDTSPVSAASVSMAVQILGPDGCMLWQETLPAQDFSNSKGAFTVTIGSGANTAAGALTWDQVFQNGVALGAGALTGTGCSGTFNGAKNDDRTMYMTFNDGSGNQTVGPLAMKSLNNNSMIAGYPFQGVPANGEVMSFNSVSGQWEPASLGGLGTVTNVATGTGLTGGPITTTGTISLANIGAYNILANNTAGAAAPTGVTLSSLIDNAISSTQGSILYRNGASWVALAPGTNGDFLRTQGAGANPVWASASTNPMTTLGDIIYGGAAGAQTRLAANGTATNKFLTSVSAGAPAWNTLATTDMPTYAINSVMITNATGTLTAGGGTTANTILQGSVTGPVWSTATYPSTTTANQLLYSSAGNTVTGLATAANGVLITSAGSVPSISSTLPSAVQGNITSVGTVASGTWNGTAIGAQYGGTGQAGGYTVGDILYASGANTLSKLAIGGANQVLTVSGGVPSWQAAGAAASVPLSGITAATSSPAAINNANYAQTWNWNTLDTQNALSLTANALTTGSVLNISSSSAVNTSSNGLLYVGNSTATTTGTIARIQSNSTAGSGLTVLANGNVGIGTASPGAKLDVKGNFAMSGSTSGSVTFAVPAAAGSATYTWPSAAPATSKVLQSDNTGALSWVAASGGDALTTNPLSQFAATTSAQLAGVISDETGTGSLVFSNSPTLTTPTLGVASATSVNKVTITAPATGSTLTIADGKTFTVNNTLTLSGTDGSTLNIGAGGTLGSNAYTSTAYAPLASPTFTGTVTIPTPFTLGATSVTSTGTQLNYLSAATGTTGTTSTNVVFSGSPTIATPTFTTSATTPLIIGGTAVGSTLTYRTTTGVGAAGADHIFQVGNNGATEAMRILNSGNVGIGTASPGAKLDVKGNFAMSGSTSGSVTFAVPAAAGSAVYTWPSAAPATSKVLQSDNTGALSWVSIGGGGDAFVANPLSQFAATTSAQLAGVISDETGTGSLVFSNSPTFTTPTLGVASATSVNKVTITAPATGSTLTIADGKTFTVNNTLTLSGTDGSTLNIGAGGTLGSNAYTSTAYAPLASPTFTGTVTIPTPFTLGATSVTTTGTQLNYLNAATGTTGTTSTNVVFSGSPTIATPTFTTSATTPLIIGGTGTTQTLTYRTTTGVGAAGADHIFQVGNNGATEAMRILNSGNVGIGVTGPSEKLDVTGNVAVTGQVYSRTPAAAGSTIDWNSGNQQYYTGSCTAFTMNNMKDGGTYVLTVEGGASATCTFSGSGATFAFVPANGPTIASKKTVYSISLIHGTAYVSWMTGF